MRHSKTTKNSHVYKCVKLQTTTGLHYCYCSATLDLHQLPSVVADIYHHVVHCINSAQFEAGLGRHPRRRCAKPQAR